MTWARRATLAAVLAWTAIAYAPAMAAGFLEKNFWLSGPRYDAVVPTCENPVALGKIQARFSEKESRFWNSSLQILDFERVREIAFRPWAVDAIPRRFCTGTVVISDGVKRRVNYSIIEDGGMIGGTWGVEWCVVGLDRNWAYNPHCRMALP
jgi:hypothetical protein